MFPLFSLGRSRLSPVSSPRTFIQRKLLCGSRTTRSLSSTAFTIKAANQPSKGESSNTVRINKCFKHLVSRREADRLIEQGRVRVNGDIAVTGSRVKVGDDIALDGKRINWCQNSEIVASASGDFKEAWRNKKSCGLVYIKYWKPVGVVCTSDERVPNNVISRIKHKERVFMVGRLDKDTSGLLLLTTDGRLVNAVCRASSGCEKTYLVRTRDPVADGELRRLREGVVITTEAKRDGRAKLRTAKTLPCEANRARGTPNAVELTIREGRNRQIRRMFAAVGHEVTGLHRTSVMSISLSGLSPGSWKELSEREIAALRSAMESAERTGCENRDTPAREARALSPAEQREAAMSAAGGSLAQLWGRRSGQRRSGRRR
uniref:23S rRNA pseudouridine2605 synthase n=1 Tax=Tetraselmis sp. GSL018 TaxID=582737 RepID=A0A061S3H8_9CHLO